MSGAVVEDRRNLVGVFVVDEEGADGHAHDLQVQPYVPVLHIPDVSLNALLHLPELFCLTTASGDLRPSRDAGLAEVTHHVFVNQLAIHLGMGEHVRTRSHEAHVANEHIEELRQLVDVVFPNEVAEGELARVVLGGLLAVCILVDVHRAELIAPERFAVEPRALLLEEDGSRALYLDDCADDEGQRCNEHACDEAHDKVECALDDAVMWLHECTAVVGEEDVLTHADRAESYFGIDECTRHVVEISHILVAGAHDAFNLCAHLVRQAAKHDVDTRLSQW